MTATPPADSDADFNLSVTLTSTETSPNGGEVDTLSADTTFSVPVTVNAVADTPTVAASDASGDEDTAIPLTGLGGALADTDGSETLSYRIEGLPAGAVLSAGTVQPGGIVHDPERSLRLKTSPWSLWVVPKGLKRIGELIQVLIGNATLEGGFRRIMLGHGPADLLKFFEPSHSTLQDEVDLLLELSAVLVRFQLGTAPRHEAEHGQDQS
ncbi:MAG: hypothetical protein AAF357_20125 [Verrucomicrobiota bacterium]